MSSPDPFGLVGQILDGQFRVDRFIGEGGFSVVYAGQHLGLSEPIALKCMKLPAQLSSALVETFVQRFRDESRLHYKLSQGNLHIARTMAAGTTVSSVTRALVPYMVLEWLDGHSMATELERSRERRPLQQVMELFETAADALSFAQSQGVVHRDLNPGNFFLTNTVAGPRLKVLDFGVAKVLDESRLEVGPRVQTMGQIRIFAPAYGAPEQFDDRVGPIGPHTDVYAFALVLLETMAGRTVMAGEHLGDFAMAALDPDKRPSPALVGLVLAPEVTAVFDRALALRPQDRWPKVKDFWAALRMAARLPGKRDDGEGNATMLLATMPLDPAVTDASDEAPTGVLHVDEPPATARLGAAILDSAMKGASVPTAVGPPPPEKLPDPLAATFAMAKGPELPKPSPLNATVALPLAPAAAPVGPIDAPKPSPLNATVALPLVPPPAHAAATLPGPSPISPPQPEPLAAPSPSPKKGDRSQLVTLAMATRPSLPGDPAPAAITPPPKKNAGLASTMVMHEAPIRPSPEGEDRVSYIPPEKRTVALAAQPVVVAPSLVTPPIAMPEGPPLERPSGPPVQAQAPVFAEDLSPAVPPTSKAGLYAIAIGAVVLVAVAVVVIVLFMRPGHDKDTPPPAPSSSTATVAPAPPSASASAPAPSSAPDVPVATASAMDVPAPSVAPSAPTTAPTVAPAKPSATTPTPTTPTPSATAPVPLPPGAFDVAAATTKLDHANGVMAACKSEGGPNGKGSASVTFAPTGQVTNVGLTVPFEGTKTGTCVRGQLMRVKTTPFVGTPQTIAYVFTVPK